MIHFERRRTRDPMSLALRALRDCKAISATHSHPGYLALWTAGLVNIRNVRGDPDRLIYSLNERGAYLASELLPWRG